MKFLRLLTSKIRFFFQKEPKDHDVAELLSSIPTTGKLLDSLLWVEEVLDWARSTNIYETAGLQNSATMVAARLRFFHKAIMKDEQKKRHLRFFLYQLLTKSSSMTLFAEAGLNLDFGFWSEFSRRLSQKFIPQVPDQKELSQIFSHLFFHTEDHLWLSNLQTEFYQSFIQLIHEDHSLHQPLAKKISSELKDASLLVAFQIHHIFLSRELRGEFDVESHPARQLVKILETSPNSEQMVRTLLQCQQIINQRFAQMESTGIQLKIVYRLETLQMLIQRLRMILSLSKTSSASEMAEILPIFISELAKHNIENRNIRPLFQQNLHLISRRIIERNGLTGEHYVTRNKQEYWKMFVSAAGGGVLTVGTVLTKFAIVKAKLPFFFEGLFASLNYAGSFTLMQGLGFTLATKQSSMTASHLAVSLERTTRQQADEFVREVTHTIRSQFVSAVGNVVAVVLAAGLFEVVFELVSGHPSITEEKALYTLHSFHPLLSGTIPYAIITGFLLWLSSLFAAGTENWFVSHRLPTVLENHPRILNMLSPEKAKRLSLWATENISGLAGNITIGFLLGMLPAFCKFFGLSSFDVRHVTLSSGSWTFALFALEDPSAHLPLIISSVIGIILIGILNIGVSMMLSIWIATKARNITALTSFWLLRKILVQFRKQPKDFFLPPQYDIPVKMASKTH